MLGYSEIHTSFRYEDSQRALTSNELYFFVVLPPQTVSVICAVDSKSQYHKIVLRISLICFICRTGGHFRRSLVVDYVTNHEEWRINRNICVVRRYLEANIHTHTLKHTHIQPTYLLLCYTKQVHPCIVALKLMISSYSAFFFNYDIHSRTSEKKTIIYIIIYFHFTNVLLSIFN